MTTDSYVDLIPSTTQSRYRTDFKQYIFVSGDLKTLILSESKSAPDQFVPISGKAPPMGFFLNGILHLWYRNIRKVLLIPNLVKGSASTEYSLAQNATGLKNLWYSEYFGCPENPSDGSAISPSPDESQSIAPTKYHGAFETTLIQQNANVTNDNQISSSITEGSENLDMTTPLNGSSSTWIFIAIVAILLLALGGIAYYAWTVKNKKKLIKKSKCRLGSKLGPSGSSKVSSRVNSKASGKASPKINSKVRQNFSLKPKLASKPKSEMVSKVDSKQTPKSKTTSTPGMTLFLSVLLTIFTIYFLPHCMITKSQKQDKKFFQFLDGMISHKFQPNI